MRRRTSAVLTPLVASAVAVLVLTVVATIVPVMAGGPGDPTIASLLSGNHVPTLVRAPQAQGLDPDPETPNPEPEGDTPPPQDPQSATRDQSAAEGSDGTDGATTDTDMDTDTDTDRATPDPDSAGIDPDPARRSGDNTVDLTSYGAACDGRTNDQPALQAAIDDMAEKGGGVVLVSGTCRIVQTGSSTFTDVPGPVTIRGATPNATLSLDTDQPGAFRQLFKVSGDDVAFEDLVLTRSADIYGIMIGLNGPANFTMDNVELDGQKDRHPGSTFHGIAIWGDSGELRDARLVRTTIRNTDYGLFQDSGVTTTTDGFTVDRSTFTGNHIDDLEFNSPSGTMTDITVTNSRFSDNRAEDGQHAGFGVGLANVQHALIQGNTFDGYRFEPVHIEDRSAYVTVHDNEFTDSFTAPLNFASHVFVVSGAHHVTITGNTFDTSANDNRIDCVYLGPGGGAPVHSVTVRDNSFMLRPNATAIGNYGVTNLTESGNTTRQLR